jgi:hypothetical protein
MPSCEIKYISPEATNDVADQGLTASKAKGCNLGEPKAFRHDQADSSNKGSRLKNNLSVNIFYYYSTITSILFFTKTSPVMSGKLSGSGQIRSFQQLSHS